MSGAVFILGINITVATVLAAGFTLIAGYGPAYRSARWIALAYGLGVIYSVLEFGVRIDPGSMLVGTLAYASFLAALVAYGTGIARKYHVQPPWVVLGVLFTLAVAAGIIAQGMPRDTLLRNLLWQTPYAAIQAITVGILYRSRRRSSFDNVLCVLLAASALQFLAKPFIAMSSGGPGAGPQGYLDTTYALFSQSLGSVFAFSVALMTVAVYVRSMLRDAVLRSETDGLSGLLNRRGFEERVGEMLASSARNGVPLALVICDIDHFKAVNDTYGHETGDRVIRVFADVLRDVAQPHPVGRIGGEEFALALSGADLQTARMVAEGARISFAQQRVEGMADEPCTASFGVAEWRAGETYGDLLRRADMALYEAKNSGRDCVRLAPPGKAALLPVNDDGDRRVWRRSW